MRIVVTGAAGHIGSDLIRKLGDTFRDLEIILIDNMATQRFSSFFNLPTNATFTLLTDDLRKLNLKNLLKNGDVVVHLAAITDAANSFENADLVEENNFNCTEAIATACTYSGAKLICISSTSVYGSQESVVDETCPDQNLLPQSPYAHTKLKEERFLTNLSNDGLDVCVFRFGTIFGTSVGMRFHTAVNKFCWQACLGLPLTVWKTAYDQRRPYLDLNDASQAIIHVIKNQIYDGAIYNVLTANYTVRTIVEEIMNLWPHTEIEFVDSKIMNQLSYDVRSSKFAATGFEPSGNLSKALIETKSLLRAIRPNSNKA